MNNIFRIGEKVEYNGERYTIQSFKNDYAVLKQTLVCDIFSIGSKEHLRAEQITAKLNDLKKIHAINDMFYMLIDNDGGDIFINYDDLKQRIKSNFDKYKSNYRYEVITCRGTGYQKPDINVEVV